MVDYPLTVHDMEKISGKKLNLVLSTEIKNISLDDIFKKTDYVVINYLSEENFGHWVCMYNNRKSKIINFFDSYGGYPDEQLKFIPKSFKIKSMQGYPELVAKLYKYDGVVEYNYHRLQGWDTNTCGRWVGMYLKICDNIFIDQFGDVIKKISKQIGMSNDKIILNLTDTV